MHGMVSTVLHQPKLILAISEPLRQRHIQPTGTDPVQLFKRAPEALCLLQSARDVRFDVCVNLIEKRLCFVDDFVGCFVWH